MVAMRLGVDQIADRRLFLELLAPAHRIDRLLRRVDHDITVTRLDKARIAAGEIDFGEAVGPDPAHRNAPIPVSLQAKRRCAVNYVKRRRAAASRFPRRAARPARPHSYVLQALPIARMSKPSSRAVRFCRAAGSGFVTPEPEAASGRTRSDRR